MRPLPLMTSALLGALLLGPATAGAQTWSAFAFPDQGFSVQLPAAPAVNGSASVTLAGERHAARAFELKSDGATFHIDVVDYKGSTLAPREVIAAAEADLVKGAKTDAAMDAQIERQGGRELSLETPDGGRSVAAIFFVGDRLYRLVGSSAPPEAQSRTGDLVRFQQSLTFIDAAGQPIARGGGGRGLPPEALEACRGKAAGDHVTLETPNGQRAATCTLVALPDRGPGRGQGRGPGGGQGRGRRGGDGAPGEGL